MTYLKYLVYFSFHKYTYSLPTVVKFNYKDIKDFLFLEKKSAFFPLKRDKYPSGGDRIALTDRHDWPGMIEVLVGEPYSEMLGDLMPKV